jgi:ribosomal protein S18 acetylase RimI-like enzyme
MTHVERSVTTTRVALVRDAEALAGLHAARITEGFLPTLGVPFLTRLYRRIALSSDASAFVVADGGQILAFAAGTARVRGLYKEFHIHDGAIAGLRAAPRVLRSWRRVLETLRYPETTAELPTAEVLAVVTADHAVGRGLGARVVDAVTADFVRRGIAAAKVTVGADNGPALAMYRRCGFVSAAKIHVHDTHASEVLVWTAP